MTVTAATNAPRVTASILRSMLSRASDHGTKGSGVLAVRAEPSWDGPSSLSVEGLEARVVPCVSALAVREALRGRPESGWLVVLTDRSESDLGVGILSHFHHVKVYTADPWEAVRGDFGAPRVERRLVAAPKAREIATGLTALRGDDPWPQARAGLLTLDHAAGAVAARRLNLGATDAGLTLESILEWSLSAETGSRLADLSRVGGEPVATLVLNWIASRCGSAEQIVGHCLTSAAAHELVALGLASRAVLASDASTGSTVRLRVKYLGDIPLTDVALRRFAAGAEDCILSMRARRDDKVDAVIERCLARADVIAADVEAAPAAEASRFLPAGLDQRLGALGDALRQATERATNTLQVTPDAALVSEADLSVIEMALEAVMDHTAIPAGIRLRRDRALAGAQLSRWLALPRPVPSTFAQHLQSYRDNESWVDRAYADAWRGVDQPELLSRGLTAVASAVRARRALADVAFAQSLASATATSESLPSELLYVENLLESIALPIAKTTPVLVVIADGMSAPVATEIVDELSRGGTVWTEAVREAESVRLAAVAALPTLTENSRCTLLSGALVSGGQSIEQNGFTRLLAQHGLQGKLLHKAQIVRTGAGREVSDEIAAAVDAVDALPVVACVLNTIDDALDRSDPGQDWTPDAVAHLRVILERARRAGRVVVLTSDHGHIIDRREGTSLAVSASSSNRSRPGTSTPPAGDAEVMVRGQRVLTEDGSAILAVDETVRYGVIKAGYHGGAAPAEVVIPVHVLTAGALPPGWIEAPIASPSWWSEATRARETPTPTITQAAAPKKSPVDQGTLFEQAGVSPAVHLADRVFSSESFASQKKQFSSAAITDERLLALLRSLIDVPSHRLAKDAVARTLGLPESRVGGAVRQIQRLLNIEQYQVLGLEQDSAVTLDLDLLYEQFRVAR